MLLTGSSKALLPKGTLKSEEHEDRPCYRVAMQQTLIHLS